MEAILKKLVASLVPLIVSHLLDNKHLLIDFLRDQAARTDTVIDDYVVGIIEEWMDGL